MAPLDISAGLPDLDADAPAGPNLEFDADFAALERAAQGKAEQQYGDTRIPAEEPLWPDVAAQAEALLERTHDLRVLVHLAVAKLHTEGFEAFAAVVQIIRQQLETRWDHVHPQLDAEDDNDPTLRANALLRLAEPIRVVRRLRDLTLATSARDGPVSWRTISVFNGTLEPEPGQQKKTEAVIRAAFTETGAERLAARAEAFAMCVHEAGAIGAVFDANTGYGNAPDLSGLTKLLAEMGRYVTQFMPASEALPEGSAGASPGASDGPGGAAAGDGVGVGAPRGAITAASLTSVSTRADAMRLLDIVCRYYEQNEPSSPLPMLIGRARALADKNFLEILRDLAPDGLMQAQNIVQPRE